MRFTKRAADKTGKRWKIGCRLNVTLTPASNASGRAKPQTITIRERLTRDRSRRTNAHEKSYLQVYQVVRRTRQTRVFPITDVELVPARDLAATALSKQRFHADVQSVHQPGRSDNEFDDVKVVATLLAMKFLEAADRMIVAGDDHPT